MSQIQWRLDGRTGWSAGHAAAVDPRDIRVGSFPLLCGRWAPYGWDGEVRMADRVTCKHCLAAMKAGKGTR